MDTTEAAQYILSTILKHRQVKFIDNITKQQTQTNLPNDDLPQRDPMKNHNSEEPSNKQPSISKQTNSEEDSYIRRCPKHEWNVPHYLEDYSTKAEDENYQALIDISYCYKALCNVP